MVFIDIWGWKGFFGIVGWGREFRFFFGFLLVLLGLGWEGFVDCFLFGGFCCYFSVVVWLLLVVGEGFDFLLGFLVLF